MFTRRRISLRITCILISLIALTSVSALEVTLNQGDTDLFSHAILSEMIYPIPTGMVSDQQESGIVLSRLFPPLLDAWKISIDGLTIHADSLVETLEHSYLLSSGKEWSVYLPGYPIIRDASSIDISGELLTDKELEVWISWEGTDELKEEILGFGKTHGIEITVLDIPNPESRLTSVIRGGGEAPDIIMSSPGKLHTLVESKALQPIPQYLSSGLDPRGNEAFSYEEKQWALPFYYDSQLFFYNPELIDLSAYATMTLSKLEGVAASLSTKVPLPLTWNAYSVFWLLPFEYSFGKENLVNDQGLITVNDTPTKRALDYIVNLNKTDYFRPTEKDAMISLFSTGRAAMIYSASYSIPYFKRLGIPFEIAPMIINDQTGLPVAPMLDFKAFGVTRNSKHPILSYRLLSHLTGLDVQYRFSKELNKLPSNRYASDLLESSSSYYSVLLGQAEHGRVIPSNSSYAAYKNIMWKLLRFALSEQMGTEEVLIQGERLLQETVSDY